MNQTILEAVADFLEAGYQISHLEYGKLPVVGGTRVRVTLSRSTNIDRGLIAPSSDPGHNAVLVLFSAPSV